MDLLSLALQGPTCDKNKIDLKQVLDTNSSESDEKGTSEGITDADMREAQEKLSKVVSGEKVQHAMIILHGFRVGATKEENHAAVVSFKVYRCVSNTLSQTSNFVFWFIYSSI